MNSAYPIKVVTPIIVRKKDAPVSVKKNNSYGHRNIFVVSMKYNRVHYFMTVHVASSVL